jgi:hypothetical protein
VTAGGAGTTGDVTVLTGGAFDLTLVAASGTNLTDYLKSWSRVAIGGRIT